MGSNSSTIVEDPESKIFYITSFSSRKESLPPFVGLERHKCSIVQLELDKLIYFALMAEGFPATEELNQVREYTHITNKFNCLFCINIQKFEKEILLIFS